jgi:hypothetical protein
MREVKICRMKYGETNGWEFRMRVKDRRMQ